MLAATLRFVAQVAIFVHTKLVRDKSEMQFLVNTSLDCTHTQPRVTSEQITVTWTTPVIG